MTATYSLFEGHHRLADMHEFGRPLADDVDAQ